MNALCPMPQSFTESRVSASVVYELAVHIVHGRFRPDSRIKTNIAYLPALIPLPPSLKRREAYEAGALLPGPISDPSGWIALPTTKARSTLGNTSGRVAQVDYTLHLAKPLSYTRGTVIPCFLKLASDDAEALDYLSSPKVPYVRLIRHLRYLSPDGGKDDALTSDDSELSLMGHGCALGTDFAPPMVIPTFGDDLKTVVHEMTHAVWWVPSKDVSQGTYVRHLEGEIHLAPDLQPSCACSIFSVEYFVEMLPFNSTYPEQETLRGNNSRSNSQTLISHPVEITTLHRLGEPVPSAFSEPPKTRIRSIIVDAIQEEPEE